MGISREREGIVNVCERIGMIGSLNRTFDAARDQGLYDEYTEALDVVWEARNRDAAMRDFLHQVEEQRMNGQMTSRLVLSAGRTAAETADDPDRAFKFG